MTARIKNFLSKIFFIIFMMSLSLSFSYAYTLVDSEDFEDYTLFPALSNSTHRINFFNEANGKWNCSNPADYPLCTDPDGAPGGSMAGNFTISGSISNKYLQAYAVDGTDADYYTTSLKWDNINTSVASGDDNYMLEFYIKLNSEQFGNLIGAQKIDAYAGIYEQYVPLGIGKMSRSIIGGLNTADGEEYTKIRLFWNTTEMDRLSNYCQINDSSWHKIDKVYQLNGTCHMRNITIYIDNIPCAEMTSSYLVGCGNQFIYNMDIIAHKIFNINIDNIKVYENIIDPNDLYLPPQETMYCPVTNCIYYDDFLYNNNYNLSLKNYYGFPWQAHVLDKRLYFNSTFYPYAGVIGHDFIDNDYSDVMGIARFYINNSPTPAELENNTYISYDIFTRCSDTGIVFGYSIKAWNDQDITLSRNKTLINIYNIENGNERQLGTITAYNGNEFSIKNRFDLDNNKAYIDFIIERNTGENQESNNLFSASLYYPCNKLTNVTFGRSDTDRNTAIDKFVQIDRIYYYGIEYQSISNEFDYEFGNKISENESLINEDAGEMLHNAAYSIGFKTSTSQLLFWVLLMMGFILWIAYSDMPSNSKSIACSAIFVIFMVIGFYFKFVNVIVFSLMILVIAIIGAIAYANLFKGSSGQ